MSDMHTYVDILNPDGGKTYLKKTLWEIHKSGYYHLAFHVWIVLAKSPGILFPIQDGVIDVVRDHVLHKEPDDVLKKLEDLLAFEPNARDLVFVKQYKSNNNKLDREFQSIYLFRSRRKSYPFDYDAMDGMVKITSKDLKRVLTEQDYTCEIPCTIWKDGNYQQTTQTVSQKTIAPDLLCPEYLDGILSQL